jgi:hypothetical protein
MGNQRKVKDGGIDILVNMPADNHPTQGHNDWSNEKMLLSCCYKLQISCENCATTAWRWDYYKPAKNGPF